MGRWRQGTRSVPPARLLTTLVGVANATDFLRPHRSGRLRVVAVPIHQGRTQQLWQVEVRRPDGDELVADRGTARWRSTA